MGKILVIAEKPSVARDIGKVLGANQKGDGCLIGQEYVISWAVGHLVTLAEPEDYDAKYKRWATNTLPIIPETMELKAIAKTRSQLKILHKWMNSAEIEKIICATDSGREGELIFRYIYEITKSKKPFDRLWISSMTEQAIKEGFAKLKKGEEYDALYQSARCRSEADWLVGMNATRAYTLQYDVLLSIGRVQTPTLALMVQRQKEIDAFQAQDYFELRAVYPTFHGMWIDGEEKTRIESKEAAQALKEKIEGKTGHVAKVEKEEKKQPPPLLYDLTELQRESNKKFGYSAKRTLDIAQSLYEKRKLVTYPRTDSRYLSDDMKGKATSTMKKLAQTEEFAPYATGILEKSMSFTKRIVDNSKVTDHHAIIPTDVRPKISTLSEEERNVYLLVVSRFFSVFSPYYRYEVTKIYVTAEQERFLSKGTVVLEDGWQGIEKALVPSKATKKKDEEEQILPAVEEGEALLMKEGEVLQKKTKAPSPYTESSLLSAMENAGRFIEDEALKEQMKDSGLGTPATRAAIIERLLSVGYLTRKGKSLLPTEKGMKLIEVVPEQLRSPETTGKWEKGLSSIAKGSMKPERFMGSIERYVHFLVGDAGQKKKSVVFPKEQRAGAKRLGKTLGKCPVCKDGDVYENSKSFFCSKWRDGCKFSFWKNSLAPYGIEVTEELVRDLLKNGKIEKLPVTLPQTSEKGHGCLIVSQDGRVEIMDFMREEQ